MKLLNVRFLATAAFAVSAAVAAACGGYRQGQAAGDLAPARVYFTNESLDQAAVYAVAGSAQIRIGTVMAGRTDTLTVPSNMLSTTVRIFARPLASNSAPQSGPLTILPGDQLAITLPSNYKTLIVFPARP